MGPMCPFQSCFIMTYSKRYKLFWVLSLSSIHYFLILSLVFSSSSPSLEDLLLGSYLSLPQKVPTIERKYMTLCSVGQIYCMEHIFSSSTHFLSKPYLWCIKNFPLSISISIPISTFSVTHLLMNTKGDFCDFMIVNRILMNMGVSLLSRL